VMTGAEATVRLDQGLLLVVHRTRTSVA
jgi:hypothetical protein